MSQTKENKSEKTQIPNKFSPRQRNQPSKKNKRNKKNQIKNKNSGGVNVFLYSNAKNEDFKTEIIDEYSGLKVTNSEDKKNNRLFNPYLYQQNFVQKMALSNYYKNGTVNLMNNHNYTLLNHQFYLMSQFPPSKVTPSVSSTTQTQPQKKKISGDTIDFKTKWKTELCKTWLLHGECKYGKNCAFAHGEEELNERKNVFNYKTKQCKQFFEAGICPYGSRCQFSHSLNLFRQKENGQIFEIIDKEEMLYNNFIENLTMGERLIKRPRLTTFINLADSDSKTSEENRVKLHEELIEAQKETKEKNNDKNSNNNNNIFNNKTIKKLSEDSSTVSESEEVYNKNY